MSFSVIIPSKNAANLRACVAAIREAGETCRIIVIEDSNGHFGGDWFQSQVDLDHFRFIPETVFFDTGIKPFVFSRNINIGIRAAGTDDVILLNDDALLKTRGGFSLLAHTAAQHPEYGIIAPACSNTGNPMQNFHDVIQVRDEPRTLCFTAVYIRRVVLNVVGEMDERYVDYGMEDDDYSLRVRKAGLKLGIFDGCFVDHGSLPSSYRGTGGGNYSANMRRFIAKWGVDNWNQTRETGSRFSHLWPEEK